MTTSAVSSAAATLGTSRFTRARFMRRRHFHGAGYVRRTDVVVRALEGGRLANNARAHAALQ
jgi:hypothetical protein